MRSAWRVRRPGDGAPARRLATAQGTRDCKASPHAVPKPAESRRGVDDGGVREEARGRRVLASSRGVSSAGAASTHSASRVSATTRADVDPCAAHRQRSVVAEPARASAGEHRGNERAGLVLELRQMLAADERLGVDLVHRASPDVSLRIPAESNAYSGRSRTPIPGQAEHPDRARRTPRSVATLGRSTSLASSRSSSLSGATRPSV